jgi:hydroxyacylglutathione hydrolase
MADFNENWFKVREIAGRVWAIDDNGWDTIYLVAGDKKALLIDTGWGIGDLPSVVRSITPLPVTVIHTHGHPDHVCASYQFSEIHIAKADLDLLYDNFEESRREMNLQTLFKNENAFPATFSQESWIRAKLKSVISIQEGYEFDLGGRCLTVIAIPGHTAGSIGLLDEKSGLLFTGDSIIKGQVWMHLKGSPSLSTYLESLRNVYTLRTKFEYLLPNHAESPISVLVLKELISGAEDILTGRRTGTFYDTFAGDGLLCDFGSCSILYNPQNL